MIPSEHSTRVAFARPVLVRDGVYEHLRRAVLDGEIIPGERIGEVELGERLGVSRTPIREALMRLTQDGLLVAEANKGVRVRTVTVREELDGLAAALAAAAHNPADAQILREALDAVNASQSQDYRQQTRLDLNFHRAITVAAHNAALGDLARDLEQRVALIKHQTRTYNAHPETAAQHAAILRAVLERDAVTARESARVHVRTFGALVLQELGTGV